MAKPTPRRKPDTLRKKTIVKPSAVAEPHSTFAAAKQWRDKQVDVLRRHPIGGTQRLKNPADGGLGRVTLLPSVKLQRLIDNPRACDALPLLNRD